MFTKHNTPIKIAVYALILTVFYLLQSVPALKLRFLGQAPELMLILTICVAYNESETFSAFFGLAAGLLNDIVTSSTVGASAIIFMFTAFFISVLLQTLLRRFFLTYVALILTSISLFLILNYIIHSLLYGYVPLGQALLKVILPKLLFSGVLAYAVYPIMNFTYKKFAIGGDMR